MLRGMFQRGGAVHIRVPSRTVKDWDGKPYQLYKAACRRTTFKNITHLLAVADDAPITCANCLRILAEQEAKKSS